MNGETLLICNIVLVNLSYFSTILKHFTAWRQYAASLISEDTNLRVVSLRVLVNVRLRYHLSSQQCGHHGANYTITSGLGNAGETCYQNKNHTERKGQDKYCDPWWKYVKLFVEIKYSFLCLREEFLMRWYFDRRSVSLKCQLGKSHLSSQ